MSRRLVAIMLASTLSACADMTHLTRTRSMGIEIIDPATNATGRHQAFFIDAKQRAIFQRGAVTCAEPSPDALSAIAASQGLSVATPGGVNVGQSLSIAEAAGAIGLRTQSIQLMRDHMYRVCEAYSAGAFPSLTMALLHRRFQTTMVGILAIEQLTSVTRAPSIVLGGNSRVGDAQALVQLSAMHETATASVTDALTALKSAQVNEASAKADLAASTTAAAAAPGDAVAQASLADKKLKLEKASSDAGAAESTLASKKSALSLVDQQLAFARSSTSSNASGNIEIISPTKAGDVSAVAAAVSSIVSNTMSLTNRDDFCIMLLAEAATVSTQIKADSPVVKSCLLVLQ